MNRLLALAIVVAACGRRPAPSAHPPACFDVAARDNSPGTNKLFGDRQVQGGGVTWAALLRHYAGRHGRNVRAMEEPPNGVAVTGALISIDSAAGATWFAIDEEGDAARFCTDQTTLLDQVRADYRRSNADPGVLARDLDAVPAIEMD